MDLIDCPQCNNHKILSRLGTICPNCNYTVGYFEGKKRKEYSKFFALTIIFPFISFLTIVFTSKNIYTFSVATLIFVYLAYKSFPKHYEKLFLTNFEKIFFYGIWVCLNSMILTMIYNVLKKLVGE